MTVRLDETGISTKASPGRILLNVHDFSAVAEFYVRTFGFRILREEGDRIVGLESPDNAGSNITLQPLGQGRKAGQTLAKLVFDCPDAASFCARASANGFLRRRDFSWIRRIDCRGRYFIYHGGGRGSRYSQDQQRAPLGRKALDRRTRSGDPASNQQAAWAMSEEINRDPTEEQSSAARDPCSATSFRRSGWKCRDADGTFHSWVDWCNSRGRRA